MIINAAPKFAFLALPPPPPSLLPHPRSISAWAESVLPGSPAPPTPAPSTPVHRHRSPHISTFRPPGPARSRSGSRLQSISSTRGRIPSASFLDLLDTPSTNSAPRVSSPLTTDGREPKIDLMAFGYASVFVNFPATTPVTPAMYKPQPAPTRLSPPPAKARGGMFKRFQSITQIRGKSSSSAKAQTKRGKARSPPAVSDYMSVEKKKRDKYAASLPPSIIQEAQLRQFLGGGSLDHNIKKIMQENAKSDVWRDEEGGIWCDQGEEREFAHLLDGKVPIDVCANEEDSFDDMEKDTNPVLSSPRTSRGSDLHESYTMEVDDSMENLRFIARTPDSAPHSPCKRFVLLALPSRPSRVAKHLRKPEFLLDLFPVPPSPRSPYRASPRATKFFAGSSAGGVVRRDRSRSVVRQRRAVPPPLQLVPPSPCLKLAVNVDSEGESKREFLSDPFEPTTTSLVPSCGASSSLTPAPGMKKKGSNLVGLFKKGERK